MSSTNGHLPSRLSLSTISSLAKQRSASHLEPSDQIGANKPIMGRTSNLTRTRSLRLPQRSRHSLQTGTKSDDTSLESEVDARYADLEQKLKASEAMVRELKAEAREAKENIEFLTSEHTVLAESLKETEENLVKERLVWIKALEEVKVWSKRIHDKLKEKCEKMKELESSLEEKNEMIDKLSAKYLRNRKVWEDNDRKATEEIKKLDDVIDHVIETLKSLPESQRSSEPIQELLDLLTIEAKSESKCMATEDSKDLSPD